MKKLLNVFLILIVMFISLSVNAQGIRIDTLKYNGMSIGCANSQSNSEILMGFEDNESTFVSSNSHLQEIFSLRKNSNNSSFWGNYYPLTVNYSEKQAAYSDKQNQIVFYNIYTRLENEIMIGAP